MGYRITLDFRVLHVDDNNRKGIITRLALRLIGRIGFHVDAHIKRLCQKAQPVSLTVLHEKHKQPKTTHSTTIFRKKSGSSLWTYLCISRVILFCAIAIIIGIIIWWNPDMDIREAIHRNCTSHCNVPSDSSLEPMLMEIVLKKKLSLLLSQLKSFKKNKI